MTTKTEVKKEKGLSERVAELASRLEAEMEVPSATGVGSPKSKDLYEMTLPENITMDLVKAVSKHNSDFIAAGTYAFGNLSVAAMTENKELNKTEIEIPMGVNDSLTIGMHRQKESTDNLHGGDTIVKYGHMIVDYSVHSGKNGGQLKEARKLIGELALSKFKE